MPGTTDANSPDPTWPGMTSQERYEERSRILHDHSIRDMEALDRLRLLGKFKGTLTEWRELLKARGKKPAG